MADKMAEVRRLLTEDNPEGPENVAAMLHDSARLALKQGINKVLIVFLKDVPTDEDPNPYEPSYRSVGMRQTEVIALVEAVKVGALSTMGLLPPMED